MIFILLGNILKVADSIYHNNLLVVSWSYFIYLYCIVVCNRHDNIYYKCIKRNLIFSSNLQVVKSGLIPLNQDKEEWCVCMYWCKFHQAILSKTQIIMNFIAHASLNPSIMILTGNPWTKQDVV